MTPKILAGVTDLVFSNQILITARQTDTQVDIEKSYLGILELAEELHPDVILIDLDSEELNPLELVRELRRNEHSRNAKVIGYLSYLRPDFQKKAREAGCDLVLTRSRLSQHLPEFLKGEFDLLEAKDGRSD